MAGKKGVMAGVQGEDIITNLRAFQEDCGCECRIVISLAPGDREGLLVRVESYTDAGTKIGVAHTIQQWRPNAQRPLLTLVMMSLHQVYHDTCQRARAAIYGTPRAR